MVTLIHFHVRFSFGGGVMGAEALGGLRIPHIQQQFQIILLALYTKMGPSKFGDVVTLPGFGQPLGCFLVGLASKNCLASLLWGILDT